jgi:hypothetical protein
MKQRLRRVIVTLGVACSIAAGAASIQLAAMYTAAAAPPSVPPVSIDSLRAQLTAEQERSAALQGQLNELIDLTGQLSGAVDTTQSQISTDGLTASQLRQRLGAAQAKLTSMTALLKQAQARLVALQQALAQGGVNPPPAAAAAAPPPGGGGPMTLTLSHVDGGIKVEWSSCSVSGFVGYAVVRATDHEIHFPPEDVDREIARISSPSTTSMVDGAAPSGTIAYQVYCLGTKDGQTKWVVKTPLRTITVP